MSDSVNQALMTDKVGKGEQVLALYGSADDLEHLAGRIKRCVPGGGDLETNEALALAQISLVTGFDPFIGEIWYIPKRGPMVGIRGLRSRARQQSTYTITLRAMTPAEITENDVRTEIGDVGYVCELYRHDVLQEAVAINKVTGLALIPIEPILGIGIWRKAYKEIGQYKTDPVPHGKSPAWVAKKRAEANALTIAFDITVLSYSDLVGPQLTIANGDDVIEAEVVQREVAANAESRSAKEDADDLFGEQALDEIEPVLTAGVAAVPVEYPVEETLPEPPEEATDVEIHEDLEAGAEEVVEKAETTKGPLEVVRQYAEVYSKRDADLAPTGGQLRLLGALCATLREFGLPRQSLFTFREMVWGEGNFIRSHFHAILRYVCEMNSEGDLAEDSSGSFVIKEGVVEELTPLLGADILDEV